MIMEETEETASPARAVQRPPARRETTKIILEDYMIQAHSIRLEYGRTSPGTIAIVETPAPMISWAISGESQAAWRIRAVSYTHSDAADE